MLFAPAASRPHVLFCLSNEGRIVETPSEIHMCFTSKYHRSTSVVSTRPRTLKSIERLARQPTPPKLKTPDSLCGLHEPVISSWCNIL